MENLCIRNNSIAFIHTVHHKLDFILWGILKMSWISDCLYCWWAKQRMIVESKTILGDSIMFLVIISVCLNDRIKTLHSFVFQCIYLRYLRSHQNKEMKKLLWIKYYSVSWVKKVLQNFEYVLWRSTSGEQRGMPSLQYNHRKSPMKKAYNDMGISIYLQFHLISSELRHFDTCI